MCKPYTTHAYAGHARHAGYAGHAQVHAHLCTYTAHGNYCSDKVYSQPQTRSTHAALTQHTRSMHAAYQMLTIHTLLIYSQVTKNFKHVLHRRTMKLGQVHLFSSSLPPFLPFSLSPFLPFSLSPFLPFSLSPFLPSSLPPVPLFPSSPLPLFSLFFKQILISCSLRSIPSLSATCHEQPVSSS